MTLKSALSRFFAPCRGPKAKKSADSPTSDSPVVKDQTTSTKVGSEVPVVADISNTTPVAQDTSPTIAQIEKEFVIVDDTNNPPEDTYKPIFAHEVAKMVVENAITNVVSKLNTVKLPIDDNKSDMSIVSPQRGAPLMYLLQDEKVNPNELAKVLLAEVYEKACRNVQIGRIPPARPLAGWTC